MKADIYERFDIDSYQNPFDFDMVAWHLVAMAIQGFVFYVLTLIVELKPWISAR